MEETILRFRYNIYRESKLKARLCQIGICIGVIVVIFATAWWVKETGGGDVINNVIASFVGVAALFVLAQLVVWLLHHNEDKNKVSYRNQDMWAQYGTRYREIFAMNKSRFVVYCEPLFYAKDAKKIAVKDEPKDFFQLDPYIKMHCSTLLEAHAMSNKLDSVTVRLTDFEAPTEANGYVATICSGRSSYLAHLLTNRALDYFIEGDLSVRKLYENDKTLRPLRRAMLSNHFGVNALVFLKKGEDKDGYLLLPHRKGNATVAKNSLTASIATRLEMPGDTFPKEYEDHMTPEYIEEGCIRDNIAKSIWVSQAWLDKKEKEFAAKNERFMDIHFLGLSRDIYEGGKPTLFYVVHLDATHEEYETERAEFIRTKEEKEKKERKEASYYRLLVPTHSIDEVEKVHIAEWSSVNMQAIKDCKTGKPIEPEKTIHDIRLDKALLTFKDEQEKNFKAPFEQNLISNFLFYRNSGLEEKGEK